MKCVLLIFTICSIERSIYVQGQDSERSEGTDEEVFNQGEDDVIAAEDRYEGSLSFESAERSNEAAEASDNRDGDRSNEAAEASDNRDGDSSSSSSGFVSSFSSSESGSASSSGSSSRDSDEYSIMPFLVKQAKQAGGVDDEKRQEERKAQIVQFNKEKIDGDPADAIGQNEHIRQAEFYNDLGRRSIPPDSKNTAAENDNYLTPEKAPPELVLLVAKESALLGPGNDADLASDFDQKKILRTGDYWNGVWKEDVKPKSAMRSGTQKKNLGSIKAKLNEGTELYQVVSKMKDISPKLLYIINKKSQL